MSPYFSYHSAALRSIFLRTITFVGVTASLPLCAADIQWIATDGNFETASNWQGGVVPGLADNAILGNGGILRLASGPSLNGLRLISGEVFHTGGSAPATINSFFRVGALAGDPNAGDAVYHFDNAQMTAGGGLVVSSSVAVAKLDMINGMITIPGGQQLSIGNSLGESGSAVELGGFFNIVGDLELGVNGGDGTFEFGAVNGGGAAAVVAGDVLWGEGGGSATFLMNSGSITKIVGQFPESRMQVAVGLGSTAEFLQVGGTFVNNNSPTHLGVGNNTTTTWTINGGTTVFGEVFIGYSGNANATVTLNEGTLTARGIHSGSTGESAFNLNGGTLTADGYSNEELSSEHDFLSGIGQVTIGGPVRINVPTVEYQIDISQDLLDGGGSISKIGPGLLKFSGDSSYAGSTSIEEGEFVIDGTLVTEEVYVSAISLLSGEGTIDSDLIADGLVLPGHSVGTLQVTGDVEINGTLGTDINGDESNLLQVDGNLDISNATLDAMVMTGEATAPAYVIATYGSLTGEFTNLAQVPDGYEVNYAYQGNQIALVLPGEATPFELWASGFGLEGSDALVNADPDGDGMVNGIEFLLGGNPTEFSGSELLPSAEKIDNQLTFTFKRVAAANSIVPMIELSQDLNIWSIAENAVDGVLVSSEPDGETGDETWTITLPATNARQFIRLRVDVP